MWRFLPPRHCSVRRNSRYCIRPFCHLFSAHFHFPLLRYPSLPPSLFLFLFASLWIPGGERERERGGREYTRKGSGARRGEKGNGGRGGKQERGISSARAKAFFKECSIIRARKSERSWSIRRDNRILTSRPPFIYWQPVAFTFYSCSIPPPKTGIHIYPRS